MVFEFGLECIISEHQKEIMTFESTALGLCAKKSEKGPRPKTGLIVGLDFGPRIHDPTK